jgi:hypothetical protein
VLRLMLLVHFGLSATQGNCHTMILWCIPDNPARPISTSSLGTRKPMLTPRIKACERPEKAPATTL